MGGHTDDVATVFGVRREQAGVGDLMLAGSGDEHGDAANEGLRREGEYAVPSENTRFISKVTRSPSKRRRSWAMAGRRT
jgi:hypothetical protein